MAAQTPMYSDIKDKFAQFEYKPITRNNKGLMVVYFGFQGKPLKFQLQKKTRPSMAPFGASVFVEKDATIQQREEKEASTRKNFAINIDDKELVEFFRAWDEHNIRIAIQNKKTWWKKEVSDEQIRTMYTSMLSLPPPDSGYPPQAKTKINTEGKYAVQVLEFDPATERIVPQTPQYLDHKPVRCICVCEASWFWFQTKSFGMSLMTSNVLVYREEQVGAFPFAWEGAMPQLPGATTTPTSIPPSIQSEQPDGSMLVPREERRPPSAFERSVLSIS